MSLVLFLFAAAAQAEAPIMVTGHAWAPFISPMGEPFRARSATDDTLVKWFGQADRDGDGVLTPDEMVADAERFFATLDRDGGGQIDPDEIRHYEWEVAPDIQVMSRTRRAPGQPAPTARPRVADEELDGSERRRSAGIDTSLGIGGALQGAARYGLLNMPQPVAAADTDFDRAVTLDEFRQAASARFQLLDTARQGRLTLAQLQAMRPAISADGKRIRRKDKTPDVRIGNPLPQQQP